MKAKRFEVRNGVKGYDVVNIETGLAYITGIGLSDAYGFLAFLNGSK